MECRFIQGLDGMQVWIGFGWDTVLTRVWVGCRLSKCPTLAEAMLGNKRLQLKGLQEVSPGSCQMHIFIQYSRRLRVEEPTLGLARNHSVETKQGWPMVVTAG